MSRPSRRLTRFGAHQLSVAQRRRTREHRPRDLPVHQVARPQQLEDRLLGAVVGGGRPVLAADAHDGRIREVARRDGVSVAGGASHQLGRAAQRCERRALSHRRRCRGCRVPAAAGERDGDGDGYRDQRRRECEQAAGRRATHVLPSTRIGRRQRGGPGRARRSTRPPTPAAARGRVGRGSRCRSRPAARARPRDRRCARRRASSHRGAATSRPASASRRPSSAASSRARACTRSQPKRASTSWAARAKAWASAGWEEAS